ncbi:MAG TPA: Shedu immune nuclease family protein [Pyrinomonadaceae bacterium]|nr:Shedu immune nuclease family protein [Pyrinomonadaceae bacterium]
MNPKTNPFDDSSDNSEHSAVQVKNTKVNQRRFPDLDRVQSVVIKDGKRVKKEAKFISILDRNKKEIHHYELKLVSYKREGGALLAVPEHSIYFTSEGDDEIQKLTDFLVAIQSGATAEVESDYMIVPTPQGTDKDALQKLVNDLSYVNKVDVLTDIIEFAAKDEAMFQMLVERVAEQPALFADAAAALNLVSYKNAVQKLTDLMNKSQSESDFQNLLEEHPWMFGSEYSELLDRRRWTRDEQQDFVVRRTTDGFIELIEIKTPLNSKNLFNYDASHSTYYPSAELSKVLGQVQHYIDKLDADRNSILAYDKEDTAKIRAKIIVGRDNDEEQCRALRRLNGHLFRIEIITFDQLLRIAENVLNYLESILKPAMNEDKEEETAFDDFSTFPAFDDDDIPF